MSGLLTWNLSSELEMRILKAGIPGGAGWGGDWKAAEEMGQGRGGGQVRVQEA